jgi:hypothetical protein
VGGDDRGSEGRDQVDPLVRATAGPRPPERVDERVGSRDRAHLDRAVGIRRLPQDHELPRGCDLLPVSLGQLGHPVGDPVELGIDRVLRLPELLRSRGLSICQDQEVVALPSKLFLSNLPLDDKVGVSLSDRSKEFETVGEVGERTRGQEQVDGARRTVRERHHRPAVESSPGRGDPILESADPDACIEDLGLGGFQPHDGRVPLSRRPIELGLHLASSALAASSRSFVAAKAGMTPSVAAMRVTPRKARSEVLPAIVALPLTIWAARARATPSMAPVSGQTGAP